ncbi:hypothetical protein Cob_v000624 [Colletotrichum orbiculare MAFF 240422]|uniref:Uncharacterized protein n=1 Tax=Colletotrichum orbiculare (strain 104-T / ATCC 96160 / CBS 514.97 / LARS 414 / MAFF 240422) TaxID=1213857 RepID=A0A484G8T5_COLOR|nr:hypothetical protein Cob_v000624 [Colletotrichum orbiculare MAFF 240422]
MYSFVAHPHSHGTSASATVDEARRIEITAGHCTLGHIATSAGIPTITSSFQPPPPTSLETLRNDRHLEHWQDTLGESQRFGHRGHDEHAGPTATFPGSQGNHDSHPLQAMYSFIWRCIHLTSHKPFYGRYTLLLTPYINSSGTA